MLQEIGQPLERLESASALAAAARRWAGATALAIDTEFVRERTFYQRLGLLQVSDGVAATLIDPQAVQDLAPLLSTLARPDTVKVLHSASEDVEVFHHALGGLPPPLFDTQVAAGLAGLGSSLSYQKLVSILLGVELGKGETRTDWLARPLTEAQLAYAAEDVAYLLPLYERLRADLEALGRLGWALEDSAALLDATRFAEEPETAYLRVRGSGRLNRRQLGALRVLASWREREARRRDRPRSFVLKDDLLLALATRQPATVDEVRRLPAFDAGRGARDASLWLELLAQAAALPADELPQEVWRPPVSARYRALEERVRDLVQAKAAQIDLPPELLASRRVQGALLRRAVQGKEPLLPRELAGWRREVIGDTLAIEVTGAIDGI